MVTCLAVFVVAVNLFATEKLAVVQGGKAAAVRYAIGTWKETAEGLESPQGAVFLFAGKDLGPGDFRISARLKLQRMEGTAASFTMNDSHLGFDGRGNKLFIEGPLFSGQKLLPEAANLQIKPGQAFDLEIVRVNGITRFLIDQHEILRMENWNGLAERIGFRPHRNRITLQRFEIEGNLVAPKQPLGTPVFTSGQDGYYGYRIPALAVTTKGTVLAICEGRKHSFSDAGNIDLVLKRSTDNGKTWSPMQVIRDDGANTAGNPTALVDRETGTIWVATCQNNNKVFVLRSDDDGVTWSQPSDITADVKNTNWTWYATGPGSGIQIQKGKYKGRLIFPCDHIEKDSKRYYSHVFYSDDHGKSWKLGGTTPQDKVNECEAVELADGRLMLNMRNYGGGGTRQIAFSEDGGETWKDQRRHEELVEPVCQAAIERYRWPEQDKPGAIIFSNPANTMRKGMTVKASFDEGKTWPVSKVLFTGLSAYSDLDCLPDGNIGCLYEAGPDYDVQYMMFASFPLDSLVSSPAGKAAVDASAYRGWKTLALHNGLIKLQILPEIGGRIIQFTLGDKEFLWVNPQLAGKMPSPEGVGSGNSWLNFGGDKLWPAPQGWDNDQQWPGPPDGVLDGQPYTMELLPAQSGQAAVRLTSRPDPRSGIQFKRTISVEEGSSHVAFEATMTNIDTKPRRWGIWSHTQLDGGRHDAAGYNDRLASYCPMNPASRFAKGYSVIFGAEDNPSFQPDSTSHMMRVSYQYRVGKIGLDSPAGWIATVNGENGVVFVQRFTFEPGREYPDGSSVEFWHNGRGSFRAWGKENVMKDDPVENPYVFESEMISPFARLQPGEHYTWHYDWYACRIGGEHPILDCTPVGVTCQALTASRAGNKVTIGGRFGVFYAANAEAVLLDETDRPCGKLDLGPVSPAHPLLLSAEYAIPDAARRMKIVLRSAEGRELGQVASLQFQPNK